jgi:hypothetical protein
MVRRDYDLQRTVWHSRTAKETETEEAGLTDIYTYVGFGQDDGRASQAE